MKSNREIRTSNIPWCTHTWNPGVGCLRGCKYCYARRIVKKFTAKYYAEAEFNYRLKEISNYPQSIKDEFYANIVNRLKQFKPTFLRSQFDLEFPEDPAIIFIDALSDVESWWESREFTLWYYLSYNKFPPYYPVIEVIKKIEKSKKHVFVVLTKNYESVTSIGSAWNNAVPPRGPLPENLILGLTMDSDTWTHTNQLNNKLTLLLNTEWIHASTRNRAMWSLEPMTIQHFSDFTADIRRRIDSGEWRRDALPDWVIYGPKTPNRKLITCDEKVTLMNALWFWRELNIPVMVKGLKYGTRETPIQPLVNAPVDIIKILKKWKKEKYINYQHFYVEV